MDLELRTPTSRVRVHHLTPDAVRITHAPLHGRGFPADRPWLGHVLRRTPRPKPTDLKLVVDADTEALRCSTRQGQVLLVEVAPPELDLRGHRPRLDLEPALLHATLDTGRIEKGFKLSFSLEPGELIYGFGTRFDALARSEGTLHLRARDAVALLQPRESYATLPAFYSNRGYLLWLLCSFETWWTLDPARGVLEVVGAGPSPDYILINGPTLKEAVGSFTLLVGRPPVPPLKSLGLMATPYPMEPQAVLEQRIGVFRERSLPLDSLILDYHWEERFHSFTWRTSLVPDADGLLRRTKAAGVQVGLILSPFLNHTRRPVHKFLLNRLVHNLPPGTELDDERVPDLYDEARVNGLIAHPAADWWLGRAGMMDFTHPETVKWWNRRLEPLYRQGVAFIKNDDGEYLPAEARSHIGMDGREYRNVYPFFYSRAHFQGMEALRSRRGFILARAAWVGSQRFPGLFLGDQKPTWNHLRSVLRAGLSLSVLGFAWWLGDIFGLDGSVSADFHRRSAQLGLLFPLARMFWRPPTIDGTRFPWSWDAETEESFRTHAELRYRLLPYLYQLGFEAASTGIPLARPMMLEFPADPRLSQVDDQLMLGDRLLLAPVLDPDTLQREVVFPDGVWHDWWSPQTVKGDQTLSVPAPPHRIPLYVKGGTIVPMGPILSHIPSEHRFEVLELHAFPPWPAQGRLYEDDGISRAWQQGENAQTLFVVESEGRRIAIRISAIGGRFAGQPLRRAVDIVLHRVEAPLKVMCRGQAVDDWRFDPASRTLRIPLMVRTHEETRVALAFAAQAGDVELLM